MTENHKSVAELTAELEQAKRRVVQLESLLQSKAALPAESNNNHTPHDEIALDSTRPSPSDGQSPEATRQHEIFFETLVNAVHEIVFLLDTAQRHIGVYGRELKQSNLSPEMFLGKTAREILGAEAAAVHEAANARALAGERVLYEWSFTGPDGERFFQTSLSPLHDEKDQVVGIVGVGRDITPIKPAAVASQKSEARYKNLVEESPDVVYQYSTKRGGIYYSPRVELILGYTPEYLVAHPYLWHRSIHPQDRPQVDQIINDFEVGTDFEVEYRIKDAHGRQHWFLDRSISRYEEDGEIIIEGLATDITSRKQMEQALQESEQRFRSFVEQTSEGIVLIGEKGRVNIWNQGAEQMTGFKSEEVLGQYFWDVQYQLLAVDSKTAARYEQLKTEIIEALETGQAPWLNRLLEVTFCHRDGSERVMQQRVFPIKTDLGLCLGSVSRDITERVETEKMFRENEERLNLVLEGAELGLWDWNIQTGAVTFNERWAEMLGYTLDEIEAKVGTWQELDFAHPDDILRVMEILKDHLEGKTDFYEVEYRLRAKSGDWKWISARGKVLNRDENGSPLRAVGIHQDITARKEAEAQIKASLAEKEVLLKEIHHRVKNNLQIIISLLNLQSRRTADPQALAALEESTSRMHAMALIHQMLYRSENLAQVDFVAYARELAAYLFYSYRAHHQGVSLSVEGDELYLDINQLVPCGLIINELVTNALKCAFPNNQTGELSIEIKTVDQGQGRECHFVVADNGVGLPPEVDISDLSSLGLQLVLGLTEQLLGTMDVTRDNGTNFLVRFPVPPFDANAPARPKV